MAEIRHDRNEILKDIEKLRKKQDKLIQELEISLEIEDLQKKISDKLKYYKYIADYQNNKYEVSFVMTENVFLSTYLSTYLLVKFLNEKSLKEFVARNGSPSLDMINWIDSNQIVILRANKTKNDS